MKKLQHTQQEGNVQEGISTEGHDIVISYQKGTNARVERVLSMSRFPGLKWYISPEGLVRDENQKYITAIGAEKNPILVNLDNIHIDGKTLREIPTIGLYDDVLFADKNFVYRLKSYSGGRPQIISIRPNEFRQLEGGYYFADGINIYNSFGDFMVFPGNPDEFKILENGRGIFKEHSDRMGLDHNTIRCIGEDYYTDSSGKIVYGSLYGESWVVEGNPDASKFTKVDILGGNYLYTDGKNDYFRINPVKYELDSNGFLVRKVSSLGKEFDTPVFDEEIPRLLQSGIITKEMLRESYNRYYRFLIK